MHSPRPVTDLPRVLRQQGHMSKRIGCTIAAALKPTKNEISLLQALEARKEPNIPKGDNMRRKVSFSFYVVLALLACLMVSAVPTLDSHSQHAQRT